MMRHRAGGLAWAAGVLSYPLMLLVALRWPGGYSLTGHAISDLGVTVCGEFSEQGAQIREVCSPWHGLFNASMVGLGVLVLLGAVLLHGLWDSRTGRAGTVLMALTGGLVAAVGLVPWDRAPDLHDLLAQGQALSQWTAMALLAVAAGRGRFRAWTLTALVVSVLGFVLFIAALDGAVVPGLGFGGAERLAFDVLNFWTIGVGLAVALGYRPDLQNRAPGGLRRADSRPSRLGRSEQGPSVTGLSRASRPASR